MTRSPPQLDSGVTCAQKIDGGGLYSRGMRKLASGEARQSGWKLVVIWPDGLTGARIVFLPWR